MYSVTVCCTPTMHSGVYGVMVYCYIYNYVKTKEFCRLLFFIDDMKRCCGIYKIWLPLYNKRYLMLETENLFYHKIIYHPEIAQYDVKYIK